MLCVCLSRKWSRRQEVSYCSSGSESEPVTYITCDPYVMYENEWTSVCITWVACSQGESGLMNLVFLRSSPNAFNCCANVFVIYDDFAQSVHYFGVWDFCLADKERNMKYFCVLGSLFCLLADHKLCLK